MSFIFAMMYMILGFGFIGFKTFYIMAFIEIFTYAVMLIFFSDEDFI